MNPFNPIRWRAALERSAIAMIVVLSAAAAALRDVEAAALVVAGIVALALTRFRKGLLGVLALGILAADVVSWMAPGAFSNLQHGEAFWDTFVPAVLTIAAGSVL